MQSAHILDIIGMNSMYYRTGSKEQKSFKECVCHKMECPGGVSSQSQYHYHISELRDCRICKDAFNIILYETDRGRQESSKCANRGHDIHHGWRDHDNPHHARGQIDTCSDHCGRMD